LSPCPNCGAQNPQNFSFCSVCAHALSEAALVAAPPAAALQSRPEAAAAPLIRIEVDRSKEFRVGSTCYLDFGVTATGLWRRINVVVQIVAGIGNRDEEHEFELSLDEQERSATHSWRFIPQMPGEQQIRSLRVAVQDLDDGKRLAFARMRREATQRPAPGYADELLRWAPLPLVEDREASWWEGRKASRWRQSGAPHRPRTSSSRRPCGA